MANRITEMAAAATLDGLELIEVAQLSPSVTITGITFSVSASDNSINDSGAGFLTAGFADGDRVNVSGFATGANNVFAGVLTSVAAGKIIIASPQGDALLDEAAGAAVTITKWATRRATAQEIADLGAGGGGSLAIDDSGSEILASASRLNFTGAGVTVTDLGGDEAGINIPGGAGGGIYPPHVPLGIDVIADFTDADTFDDWTIITQTNMDAEIGFHGAELEQIGSTQGLCLSLLRPIADFGFDSSLVAGDAIVIRMLALGESAYFHVTAPCFTNGVTPGAGTQIVGQTIPFHQSGLGRMCFAAATYNNFTTRTDSAADGFFNLGASAPIWVRLVFLGSNVYRMDISADGLFWLPGNTRTNSLTVSHAGFLFTRINGDGSPGRGKTSIQICGKMTGVS